jgi:hypothetical protein
MEDGLPGNSTVPGAGGAVSAPRRDRETIGAQAEPAAS